jgi:ligand-binding sensor domain-containing protein
LVGGNRVRFPPTEPYEKTLQAITYFLINMKNKKPISFLIFIPFFFLISCSQNHNHKYPYHLIPDNWVYNIKQHNDSIYFSTPENGIFRFHPNNPQSIERVCSSGKLPFRGLVFKQNGSLYASSYYSGVYRVEKDTMVPLMWAQIPSWSMKQDSSGALWIAGDRGVRFERSDSMVPFTGLRDVHDLAFLGNSVAVAHMRGISIFNRESGSLEREFCKGIVCWTIARFDSVLIGSGSGVCVVIGAASGSEIRYGPPGNLAWAIEKDSTGSLFLGTQKGLYRVAPGADSAECIGFKGKCIKSLFIDNRGWLWVGRYFNY